MVSTDITKVWHSRRLATVGWACIWAQVTRLELYAFRCMFDSWFSAQRHERKVASKVSVRSARKELKMWIIWKLLNQFELKSNSPLHQSKFKRCKSSNRISRFTRQSKLLSFFSFSFNRKTSEEPKKKLIIDIQQTDTEMKWQHPSWANKSKRLKFIFSFASFDRNVLSGRSTSLIKWKCVDLFDHFQFLSFLFLFLSLDKDDNFSWE